MPEAESVQRFFPLIKSNTERLLIASTLDSLIELGLLPRGTTQSAFISLCFSRGFNDYLKEVVIDE
jgi:hypothetical protein|tara:strand:- start:79 stop:276 length:198 start_codon:yes stop_codon:yes gene_type:complete